ASCKSSLWAVLQRASRACTSASTSAKRRRPTVRLHTMASIAAAIAPLKAASAPPPGVGSEEPRRARKSSIVREAMAMEADSNRVVARSYNPGRAICPCEPGLSDDRPVGLFDSGVGGLTILREVHGLPPGEQCLYFADSRECPYGTKPVPIIQQRCEAVVDFLLDHDAKAIVVACNTASVAALAHLRARYRVPFVGIVPGVKPAAGLTRVGRIGVLATPTTAESEPLAQLIQQF